MTVRFGSALLVAMAATILLGGCATRWYKAGATRAQFEETLSACQIEASRAVPPDMRYTIEPGTGYHSEECGPFGCSGYSTYTPPSQSAYDANAGVRAQYVRACLYRHGWSTNPGK